jgi:hypothetical protein
MLVTIRATLSTPTKSWVHSVEASSLCAKVKLRETLRVVAISVDQIQTIKSQRDYRVGDVIYHWGYKWRESMDGILSNPTYDGTILKEYLQVNPDHDRFDPHLFGQIISRHAEAHGILERSNVIGVHIRAGDVITVPHRFLSIDYVSVFRSILLQNPGLDCINLVVCLAYGNYYERGLWEYEDRKQQANQLCLEFLFNELESRFQGLIDFELTSSSNSDIDLINLYTSGFFVADRGGFSRVINEARRAHGKPSLDPAS